MGTVSSIRIAALLSIASVARAQPAAPKPLNVVPAESSISYTLVHKLHKFTGVAKGPEGKVALLPDGRALVMVRVRSDAFDSGNSNRDAHAKEAVEAHSFPVVEVKGLADKVVLPVAPAALDKPLKIQITFHGVSQSTEVPVKLQALPGNRFRATTSFAISLEAFKVERPSLLAVKVDDALRIEADLVLAQ